MILTVSRDFILFCIENAARYLIIGFLNTEYVLFYMMNVACHEIFLFYVILWLIVIFNTSYISQIMQLFTLLLTMYNI